MPPKKLTFSQNALWNTAGAVVFNLGLWVTTMAVVRLSPDYRNAGILQLCMTVTNVFALLAAFHLKAYLVSDVGEGFAPGEYRAAQLTASAGAFLLCAGYALLCGYRSYTLACLVVYMLFRTACTWAEIGWGVEQRAGRMDYVGLSNILRGVGTAGGFCLALALAGSLLFAVAVMLAAVLGVYFLYDKKKSAAMEDLHPVFRWKSVGSLLWRCLPAVLSAALFSAVTMLPRQALSALGGEEALGYYATAATPVVIVQVLVTSLFDPLLRTAAEAYAAGDRSVLKRMGVRLLALLLGVAAAGLLGVYLLGEWALVLLYGESIREYAYLLYAVVGCTVLFCACTVCIYMMIVMRKMWLQSAFTALALLLAAVLGRPMIRRFGLNGVSVDILLSYALFLILSLGTILRTVRKKGGETT